MAHLNKFANSAAYDATRTLHATSIGPNTLIYHRYTEPIPTSGISKLLSGFSKF